MTDQRPRMLCLLSEWQVLCQTSPPRQPCSGEPISRVHLRSPPLYAGVPTGCRPTHHGHHGQATNLRCLRANLRAFLPTSPIVSEVTARALRPSFFTDLVTSSIGCASARGSIS